MSHRQYISLGDCLFTLEQDKRSTMEGYIGASHSSSLFGIRSRCCLVLKDLSRISSHTSFQLELLMSLEFSQSNWFVFDLEMRKALLPYFCRKPQLQRSDYFSVATLAEDPVFHEPASWVLQCRVSAMIELCRWQKAPFGSTVSSSIDGLPRVAICGHSGFLAVIMIMDLVPVASAG